MVKVLIEHGITPDVKDASGDTPMHWAVRRNDLDSVNAILESDPYDSTGMTPVWKSLAAKNQRQRTPLDIAELKKFNVLVKLLLRK